MIIYDTKKTKEPANETGQTIEKDIHKVIVWIILQIDNVVGIEENKSWVLLVQSEDFKNKDIEVDNTRYVFVYNNTKWGVQYVCLVILKRTKYNGERASIFLQS